MSDRDEGVVGRVAAWVWDVAEEEPPYPPGYEPSTEEVTGEDEPESYWSFVRVWTEENPGEGPPKPADYRITRYLSPTPELLDSLHPAIPITRLHSRIEKWEADAREREREHREEFWRERAEAVAHLIEAGYVEGTKGGQGRKLVTDLQRRARAAQLHAATVAAEAVPSATTVGRGKRTSLKGWKQAVADALLVWDPESENWDPRTLGSEGETYLHTWITQEEMFRRAEKSPRAPTQTKNRDGNTSKRYLHKNISDEERGGKWPAGDMTEWYRLVQKWRSEGLLDGMESSPPSLWEGGRNP